MLISNIPFCIIQTLNIKKNENKIRVLMCYLYEQNIQNSNNTT